MTIEQRGALERVCDAQGLAEHPLFRHLRVLKVDDVKVFFPKLIYQSNIIKVPVDFFMELKLL